MMNINAVQKLVFLFVLISNLITAHEISGIITDSNGVPLEGADIVLSSDLTGTSTDSQGRFRISFDGEIGTSELKISFLGYKDVSLLLTAEKMGSDIIIRMVKQILPVTSVSVSARKNEESIHNIPLSVASVNGNWSENAGMGSLAQIAAFIPNVFAEDNNDINSGYTIRGIRGGVTGRAGGGSPEGLFINGNYMGRKIYFNQDVLDCERIEFLRGPQSTLFGKNTLSGAINLVTRKAARESSLSVRMDLAEHGKSQLSMTSDFFSTNQAFHKLSFNMYREKDYLENHRTGAHPEHEGLALRYDLRFLKIPQTIVDFSLDYFLHQMETGRGGNVADWGGLDQLFFSIGRDITDGGPRTFNCDLKGNDDTKGIGGAVTVTRAGDSGSKLVSQTAYRTVTNDILADSDQTILDFLYDDQEREFKLFTQEIRYHSAADKSVTWLVGIHGMVQDETTELAVYPGVDFDILYQLENDVPPHYFSGSGANITPHTILGDHSMGLFGSADILVGSNWTLTTGISYNFEEKDLKFSQNGIPEIRYPHIPGDVNGDNQVDGVLRKTYRASAISPLLSAKYRLSENINLYATLSQGFKSGGFNTDFVATQDAVALPFDPEHMTNYEMGLKLIRPDKSLAVNFTTFYMVYKDMQVSVYRFNEGFRIMNAASAGIRGFETDLTWIPAAELSISASVGYSNGEFDDYHYIDSDFNEVDMSGEKISSAPEVTGGLLVDYSRNMLRDLRLLIGLEYDYRSHYKNLVTERDAFFTNKSRGLTNLRIGIERGSLTIFLWSHNIFDEEYTTLKTRDLMLELKRETWGAPRTAGLRILVRL